MNFQKMIQENRWTAFMLFFVVVLYSILFITGVVSKKAVAPHQASSKLTAVELKQKEDSVKQKLAEHPAFTGALSLAFISVLLFGIGRDVWLLNKMRQGRSWIEDPLPFGAVNWGMKEVFQVAVFLFFTEGCLFIFQAVLSHVLGIKFSEDILLLLYSFIRDVSVTIFILFLVRRVQNDSFSSLGLSVKRFFSFVKVGLLAYVAVLPVLVLVFTALATLAHVFSYEPAPQNVVQIYLKKSSEPILFVMTLFVAALGPVFEEIFFRGFTYPALRKRWGVRWAAVAVAGAFAAIHMNAIAFLPIFMLGIFLSYLYESTGSLVPSITAHVLHNTLMVFVTLGFRTLAAG